MNLLTQINEFGIDYTAYKEKLQKTIDTPVPESADDLVKERYGFTKLNQYRMTRVEKTYIPSDELKNLISRITNPQTWMIISAVWCGDSAQNVPAIVKMAELNKLIDIRLIERDEHFEIMDMFLTNGGRSIPKLVVFDDAGDIVFQWGSRPAGAQQVVVDSKALGLEKPEWEVKLHLWYARNRSVELEAELVEKLKK